jgi:hypothetical protein
MVGELRLIISPVDAEMGRGNAQMQVSPVRETNKVHRQRGMECSECCNEFENMAGEHDREFLPVPSPAGLTRINTR